jgi:hypothetical protein
MWEQHIMEQPVIQGLQQELLWYAFYYPLLNNVSFRKFIPISINKSPYNVPITVSWHIFILQKLKLYFNETNCLLSLRTTTVLSVSISLTTLDSS